ncbi:MAG TPA: acetyltransferase [Burkholderiales bacterium]|nr:acetyltransferase [Burkholderiales bacterium]
MPKSYDIFNGDADGLCALHQLRLENPREAELVTGVKRDIRLLDRIDAQDGDDLTVLDISMKANAVPLARALERGAKVRYFDHHAAGDIPPHPNLEAHIDTAPQICTSLIVDGHVGGRHRMWAVVAAFGDNLVSAAVGAAQPLGLDHTELARLHELGECLNYNAYGESLDDLHYHPADLYETLAPYRDPRHFIFDEPVFGVLRSAYAEDLYRADELAPHLKTDALSIYVLPDAAWSRRVNGVFGNRLAQGDPKRAHAVLVTKPGGYVVSVRSPLERPLGAAVLCEQFDSGGGREAAAGINFLPESELERFISLFQRAYTAG